MYLNPTQPKITPILPRSSREMNIKQVNDLRVPRDQYEEEKEDRGMSLLVSRPRERK